MIMFSCFDTDPLKNDLDVIIGLFDGRLFDITCAEAHEECLQTFAKHTGCDNDESRTHAGLT